MDQRTFNLVAGLVFAAVTLLHIVRLYLGWPMVIDTWSVPIWLSWLGCALGGVLCASGLRLYSKR
jgi:hypothetical protein